jgi:hypothetical protein
LGKSQRKGQAVSDEYSGQTYRERLLEDNLKEHEKRICEHQLQIERFKERIHRLERAGDMLCAAAAFLGWHGEIEQWNKVKGQKP